MDAHKELHEHINKFMRIQIKTNERILNFFEGVLNNQKKLGELLGLVNTFYCRKCDEVEVKKEGDLCVRCAADRGGGNDSETEKEDS